MVTAILTVAFIGIFVSIILYTANYFFDRKSYAPTITFSTWLKFYELAPEHWNCTCYDWPVVLYCKRNKNRWYEEKRATVNISFFTAWQYYIWKQKHTTNAKKEFCVAQESEFLLFIQEDIDEVRAKAIEQVEKSLKESQEHVNKILKETRNQ